MVVFYYHLSLIPWWLNNSTTIACNQSFHVLEALSSKQGLVNGYQWNNGVEHMLNHQNQPSFLPSIDIP
jgi:hypothetical protein